MSFLIRSFTPLRASSRALQRSTAAFSTSALRPAMSESDHDTPNRASEIEKHKQDSLKKQREGRGEAKSELATGSEQGVRADNNDMSMEEMQKMGEKNAEQGKQPSGSSSNKA